MQRFISDAQWDDENIIIKYRSLMNEDLGSPNGALIFDESGFAKKGNDSIGVAKQYKCKGEICTKTILSDVDQKPISVSTLAQNINDYFWYRRQLSDPI